MLGLDLYTRDVFSLQKVHYISLMFC